MIFNGILFLCMPVYRQIIVSCEVESVLHFLRERVTREVRKSAYTKQRRERQDTTVLRDKIVTVGVCDDIGAGLEIHLLQRAHSVVIDRFDAQ